MITINGIEFRNLEEQVLKNKQDIEAIVNEQGVLNQFGIKVVGQVDSLVDLPVSGNEYGDAYAVGTAAPFDLYVWTRANTTHPNDYWFNIGSFPAPGPQGIQGSKIFSCDNAMGDVSFVDVAAIRPASQLPVRVGDILIGSNNQLGIVTSVGTQTVNYAPLTYVQGGQSKVLDLTGPQGKQGIQGIQGLQGIQGIPGPQGKQGIQGIQGIQGPVGPVSNPIEILGELTNVSQLPDPTTVARNAAYIVTVDNVKHLYLISGATAAELSWVDFGVAGLPGPEGAQGKPGEQGATGETGPAGRGITGVDNVSDEVVGNQTLTTLRIHYSDGSADDNVVVHAQNGADGAPGASGPDITGAIAGEPTQTAGGYTQTPITFQKSNGATVGPVNISAKNGKAAEISAISIKLTTYVIFDTQEKNISCDLYFHFLVSHQEPTPTTPGDLYELIGSFPLVQASISPKVVPITASTFKILTGPVDVSISSGTIRLDGQAINMPLAQIGSNPPWYGLVDLGTATMETTRIDY